MNEQTAILNPAGENLAIDSFTPEMLLAAGDALTKSLLFALSREYLDGSIFDRGYFRLLESALPQQPDLAILELEQVGKPVSGNTGEYFTAIQTTLSACHDPRYALLF